VDKGVSPVVVSKLVQGSDKFLYGVTSAGGANKLGVLFKISTTGTGFTVLHRFPEAQRPLRHYCGRLKQPAYLFPKLLINLGNIFSRALHLNLQLLQLHFDCELRHSGVSNAPSMGHRLGPSKAQICRRLRRTCEDQGEIWARLWRTKGEVRLAANGKRPSLLATMAQDPLLAVLGEAFFATPA
jgi:uncharacterized repeat protein (TIGR03803 family)